MGAASSAKVLATGSVWRLTGRAAAAVPLIHEGLTAYGPSQTLVEILGSIGTDTARIELQRVASSGSRHLAQAAQQALRTLDEIDRSQS